MQGKKGQILFREYSQHQLLLLPPSLEELIDAHHPVRVVNEVVDKIDLKPLYAHYEGGGAPVFHPKMMLKVLIYGYLSNTYSSRRLEAACKENIHFMWLAGFCKPDHNTLNRFRTQSLAETLRPIFNQIVLLLVDEGLLSLQNAYIDGTKIEAQAGRYTFVWAKSVKNSRAKILNQLKELWDFSQKIAADELAAPAELDLKEISPQRLAQTVAQIDETLAKKIEEKQVPKEAIPKEITATLKKARKEWPAKLAELDKKEEILAGRGSYSKTDPDATFMRTKDDHLGNGQLKPCYNCQITTSEQFITHYTLHPNAGDTTTLIPHLTSFKESYNTLPKMVCADAGYGSEENYTLLKKEKITAVVKYNTYHKEKTKAWKADIFKTQNLVYNKATDTYTCPSGQPMAFKELITSSTSTGFKQITRLYEAQNCTGCPLRDKCFKAQEGNRKIEINPQMNALRARARKVLESKTGQYHRKKRCVEVESVFGNLKANHHFRRFALRSHAKVEIEFGLLSIAQNLRKTVQKRAQIG
jgi:transposase